MQSHIGYLSNVVKPVNRAIALDEAVDIIQSEELEFDTIVVTGVSGMFGAILADKLNIPLTVVRKDRDDSHSHLQVECGLDLEIQDNHEEWEKDDEIEYRIWSEDKFRWIFVDDIIYSGDTLNRVYHEMMKIFPNSSLVGTYEHETSYEARLSVGKDLQEICDDIEIGELTQC